MGHSDPQVIKTAREQLERFVHTDYTVAPYALYSELAGRLAGLVPGGEKAAFFNSGSEAVENAIKMSRVYTGRKAVISFEGGFHGRTWLALALTSKTTPYKQGPCRWPEKSTGFPTPTPTGRPWSPEKGNP